MIQIPRDINKAADHEVAENVRSFLLAHHVPSLRRLAVSVQDGTVTLQGRVRTFYEKQLSQQCLRRIPGVQHLVDALIVDDRLLLNIDIDGRDYLGRTVAKQGQHQATEQGRD